MSNFDSESWKFRWIESWSEIWSPSFLDTWREMLQSEGNTPFFHPTVVQAWLKTFGQENVIPHFLVANKEETKVLWPMVCLRSGWKQGYVRHLRPVGSRLFDYHDPIVHGPEQLDDGFWNAFEIELARSSSQLCDSIEIPRIRRTSLSGRVGEFEGIDVAPYLDLSQFASVTEFLATRKQKLRTDVRRQIRRLEEQGELGFRTYDSDSLPDVYSWIPDLERSRKEKYPESILPANYLNNLVGHGVPESVVHCSTIDLDGKPISWHIGFVHDGIFYWYIPLYDIKYAKHSPGKLHLYYAIEWAIANGFTTFDFLRGVDSYKSGWTDGEANEMVKFECETRTLSSAARRFASRVGNRFGYLKVALRGN